MMKTIKNGNGRIKNLNLYNQILKKFVYELQVPIAAAKGAAESVYEKHMETNKPVDQIIADSRKWAQECLPDTIDQEKIDGEEIQDRKLFFEIVQKLKNRMYPVIDAKIQAYGIYNLIVKEGWKDSIDSIIDSSDSYAMETLPDLHK
ncbi:MAG: hypothetical protein MJZ73_11960 [Bacteroidaceae bacterium]|nr:hypothetical protein [Bacteroidaceae bacterium]